MKIWIQAFLPVLPLCLDFVDNNQCHKARVCPDKQNLPFQRLYQLYSWHALYANFGDICSFKEYTYHTVTIIPVMN